MTALDQPRAQKAIHPIPHTVETLSWSARGKLHSPQPPHLPLISERNTLTVLQKLPPTTNLTTDTTTPADLPAPQAALMLTQLQYLDVTADFKADWPLLCDGSGTIVDSECLRRHSLQDLKLQSWARGGAHRVARPPATLRLGDLQLLACCPHLASLSAPSIKAFPGADQNEAGAATAAMMPLHHLLSLTVGNSGAASKGGSLRWAGALSDVFPSLTSLTATLPVSDGCRLGVVLECQLAYLNIKDTTRDGCPNSAYLSAFSLADPLPALHSLTLRNASATTSLLLLGVSWECVQLECLTLTSVPALYDDTAALVVRNLPRLRDVKVKECHSLTIVGVRALAAAPSMRRLDVRRCRYVSRRELLATMAEYPDVEVLMEGCLSV